MKIKTFFAVLTTLFVIAGCCNKNVNTVSDVNVIPLPHSMLLKEGTLAFDNANLAVNAPESDKANIEALFARESIPVSKDSKVTLNFVVSEKVEGIASPEGYRMTTDGNGITVEATSGAGLFYGAQTILQIRENNGAIPFGTICDEPQFGYRGMMMDVSRHFFDKDFVKKQIDAISRYKMNRLHLHLTDAAGWRVEIKKYPRLTQLGAWRDIPGWKEWWNNGRRYAEEGSENAHGGYYTQDEIREIVQYAAERYLTIIPEIEMPAHSEEALTAYPEYSCTHEPYKQADFCVGNEATFKFLEDVLSEVMELFPSEYIHIGGDEAGKASWHTCPLCRQRMKDEGLKDVDELQSYLIHRIEKFVNSKGRKIIGWDEILDGGLAPNATVMSWRGTQGGIDAAKSGHRAIMSPGTHCYLDQYQDAPHTQPEAIGGYLPLEKVYSYNPIPEELNDGEAKFIYGVQGNLWAEYIPTEQHFETMAYPRILALAEIGWGVPEERDFDKFRTRALTAIGNLRERGYTPFDLENEVGNRPEAQKPITSIAIGKKAVYAPNAPYFQGYAAGGDSALVDGKRGSWNNNDGAWQGFIKNGVDVTIDLGEVRDIKSIGADFMQICNPEIFMPAKVEISISADNVNFETVADIDHTVVRDDVLSFKNFGWEGNAKARYIHYRAKKGNFGGWLFVDEIVVE